MNIIFHTVTAIGVTAALTDTARIEPDAPIKKGLTTGLAALMVGVFTHAAIDFIPTRYIMNFKLDASLSIAIILAGLWLVKKPYKLIVALSFLGCLLPDLIDVSPSIILKYTGYHLPITDKIFPWHWGKYASTVFNCSWGMSKFNQTFLVITIGIICLCRRLDLKRMIRKIKF